MLLPSRCPSRNRLRSASSIAKSLTVRMPARTSFSRVELRPTVHETPLATGLLASRARANERWQRREDEHGEGKSPLHANHGDDGYREVRDGGEDIERNVHERSDER